MDTSRETSRPEKPEVGLLGIVGNPKPNCKRHHKHRATHNEQNTTNYFCFPCAIAEIVRGAHIVKIPTSSEIERHALTRRDQYCTYISHKGAQAQATHTCGTNNLCAVCTGIVRKAQGDPRSLPDCVSCPTGFATFETETLNAKTLRICGGCKPEWERARHTLVQVPKAH